MGRFSTILIVTFIVTSILSANNMQKSSIFNYKILGTDSQGGLLEFNSKRSERVSNTLNNCESIVLRNYEGLPLKALQLRIVIETKGKLKIKSLSRGSSIPAAQFMFDYQIHRGTTNANGFSTDQILVVFLGNGNYELLPADLHEVLTINYDILEMNDDCDSTYIHIKDVVGATSMPIQDANISAGEFLKIVLNKEENENPEQIVLHQNYPNPFNPSTKINFTLITEGLTILKIYDVNGQEVKSILNEYKQPGNYEVIFNADALGSGVYFCKVVSGNFSQTMKMILAK